MTRTELSKLSDEELIEKKKKLRNTRIINATLIGFLAGVIIWSFVKSTWGLFTLIPLFLIYKLVNSGNNDEGLEDILKERNLD